MSKKNSETVAPNAPLFIIRVAPGRWAGSPLTDTVDSRERAASFKDEAEALRLVKTLPVGQVEAFVSRIVVGPRLEVALAPARAKRPAEPKATEPAAPKAPKGPALDDVLALLRATGLPHQDKSAHHFGDPKGPRMVVGKGAHVTRVWLYNMPEAEGLLGWVSAADRKAKGLGKVSHVSDVSTLDQVRALLAAVCQANGVELRKDGQPKAKSGAPRKGRRAGGGETKAQAEVTPQTTERPSAPTEETNA